MVRKHLSTMFPPSTTMLDLPLDAAPNYFIVCFFYFPHKGFPVIPFNMLMSYEWHDYMTKIKCDWDLEKLEFKYMTSGSPVWLENQILVSEPL